MLRGLGLASLVGPKKTKVALMILLTVNLLMIISPAAANHAESSTWASTYATGYAYSVQQTRDGGFVVGGRGFGAWVLKTSTQGRTEWNRYYVPVGYADSEVATVEQTRDGGYIISGSALRFGGWDAWLLKIDNKGDVEWSNIYRGATLSRVEQTLDGGYIAAGNFGTIGANERNGWVRKLDFEGQITWQEVFEGQDVHYVDQTGDGGFVGAGTIGVNNSAYAWVFRLDRDGEMLWQKAWGVTAYNPAYAVQQTRDGGYIVVGEAVVLTPFESFQSSRALVLRLSRKGDLLWQKLFDGGGFSRPFSVDETFDDGFIVAGMSRPTTSGQGVTGSWLLRLDSQGNIGWQKLYPVTLQYARSTRDKGIIVAGSSVLKLDEMGNIPGCLVGVPSNETLTNVSPSEANPTVMGVGSNAVEASTSVNITAVSPTMQIQCIGSLGRRLEPRL